MGIGVNTGGFINDLLYSICKPGLKSRAHVMLFLVTRIQGTYDTLPYDIMPNKCRQIQYVLNMYLP